MEVLHTLEELINCAILYPGGPASPPGSASAQYMESKNKKVTDLTLKKSYLTDPAFKKGYLFYMRVFLHVCVCTTHVTGVWGGQERASDPLKWSSIWF